MPAKLSRQAIFETKVRTQKKRLAEAPLQIPLGIAHDAPPSSKFPTLSRGPTLEAFVLLPPNL